MKVSQALSWRCWATACFALLWSQLHAANDFDRRTLQLTPATSAVVVDGQLNEDAWKNALKLQLNYEVRPRENVQPPVETEVFLTYDETHFLVAFRAYDPDPGSIRARFTDRDRAWNDDFVGVVLDTFNDQRRAYELMCNPLGVQIDAINDDLGGNYDDSWNAIWNSKGRIVENGYVVEIAIPFNQLRFQDADGAQTWGIDIIRSYPRRDRHHIGLFPRVRGQNSYLAQTMKIMGMHGISPGKNLEVVPTFTGGRSESRSAFPDGGFDDRDSNEDIGVTARWGITPNLTLNGTLNPDFSQVEADSVQLGINQTFALFFRETRPFFLEGADYFNTRMNLVHTRTIANPSSALKVTGKNGRHTYGAFTARDDLTGVLVPGSQSSNASSFDFQSTSTIGRYRYDFGGASSVGALITNREGSDDYHNRVLSLDTTYRLTEADVIRLNVAGSQTQYNAAIAEEVEGVDPDETLQDVAIDFSYRHSERNWNSSFTYQDMGRDFRADSGFMPQVDYRRAIAGGNYRVWGDDNPRFRYWEIGGDVDQTEDQNSNLIEREAEVWYRWAGGKESFITARVGSRERVFEGVSFDQFYQSAYGEVRLNGSLYFNLNLSHGDWIDFTHVRPATQQRINPFFNLNVGRHFSTRLSHNWYQLDVEDGELFTTNVTEMRFVYQFTPRMFVRSVSQYVDIARNTELYDEAVDAATDAFFNQVLFGYKFDPRTVAFLGYSDNYEGDQQIELTQRDRTVFFKLGYAWTR